MDTQFQEVPGSHSVRLKTAGEVYKGKTHKISVTRVIYQEVSLDLARSEGAC